MFAYALAVSMEAVVVLIGVACHVAMPACLPVAVAGCSCIAVVSKRCAVLS